MNALVRPSDVTELAPITAALDAASPEDRFAWVRSLGKRDQLVLFALAKGNACSIADITAADMETVTCDGKNGLPMFNNFRKVFVRMGGQVAGYNDNAGIAGPFTPILSLFTGPGHFTAYDVDGEVWIDYRTIPSAGHPSFPPLVDNEHGLRALTFGNMVDVVRRVSEHVFIGDAYKDKPRPDPVPFMARVGSMFPTAPFAMCRRV